MWSRPTGSKHRAKLAGTESSSAQSRTGDKATIGMSVATVTPEPPAYVGDKQKLDPVEWGMCPPIQGAGRFSGASRLNAPCRRQEGRQRVRTPGMKTWSQRQFSDGKPHEFKNKGLTPKTIGSNPVRV